jgi:hypothetical protein
MSTLTAAIVLGSIALVGVVAVAVGDISVDIVIMEGETIMFTMEAGTMGVEVAVEKEVETAMLCEERL